MSGLSIEQANTILHERFAPWIVELGFVFEQIESGRVSVRLPANPRIARTGGMICGQALMALADTMMVFAVASRVGGFVDMATVGQTASFFRAAAGGDLVCKARILKMGRTLAFGEAVMAMTDRPDDPVAQATMTYALAGPK